MAERLKMYRVAKGLNQKELAQKIGISRNALINYENNKRQPSLEVLVSMSNFFEVSVDSLIGNDEYSNNDRLFELEEENLKLRMKIEEIIKLLKD